MRFGCHISIRKGYLEAARTAVLLGAQSFQYFPKNPRSLMVKAYNRSDAESCERYCREHGILTIAHTPYPTNLAVDEGELRQATIASLRNDLEIADACGSVGVVVHFGKYKGKDPLQGYKNIIECINEVLAGYPGRALLLIENQAGEGSLMGTTLEELVQIRGLCRRPELIGFCFDTCHAFASKLFPALPAGWPEWERHAEAVGYLPHLRAIHLNDSVYARGACKDRHAMIGKGQMGEALFLPLLRSQRLKSMNLPVVLETPLMRGTTHAGEIRYVKELSEG
ncbi:MULTISPECIES: deoxyribonuclease IV [Paenibacillus]|uniref:Endonuclease IV n=1 Tax=Paenibacillus naphthalenovorans TaxID=162209 RepID=A0A0U2U7Z2_9BACL|nr:MULTISPECIES: deoxyribonuclease IV [Paenibacillus]ALS22473.1 endonuclease IV [Paenibacillus naphthalenovorans]NTZ16923.1 deoxyribonuclease IV [Paenibacillus sp. JMULE4]SDH87374.1 deoxyribonuclease-4 [Paenibacillus naphthalenovorans]